MSVLINDKSGATTQQILLAGNTNTDQVLNGSSKNAIANKAVYNALADKIEKTVNDLVYYYDKSQVYNKTETRALISTISTMDIRVVNSLPTEDISTTTIYFLKQSGSNNYDEYVYVDNAWVKIGDTNVDLTGYMTTTAFDVAIADYYNKTEIDAMVANYYTKTEMDTALVAKQDVLTFDTTPIAGSTNPVTSGGIYTALNSLASGGIRFNPSENTVQVYNPNLNRWFDIHTNVLDSLDYIELQYITVSSGTLIQNQPYYNLTENEWEMGFDFAFANSSVTNGALTVTGGTGGMWFGNYQGYFVLRRFSVQDDIRITPSAADTRHTYVVKSDTTNRKLYIDDDLKGTSTAIYSSTAGNHIMFCDTGSISAAGKFYGYWYKANGQTLSNCIPVKKRSNGTVGIYDMVRDVFMTPTEGSFSPGPVK